MQAINGVFTTHKAQSLSGSSSLIKMRYFEHRWFSELIHSHTSIMNMTQTQNRSLNNILLIILLSINNIYISGRSITEDSKIGINQLFNYNSENEDEVIVCVSTLDYSFMRQISEYLIYTINNLPISSYTKKQLHDGFYNITITDKPECSPNFFVPIGSYRLHIWFQPEGSFINKFYFKVNGLNFTTELYLNPYFSSVEYTSLYCPESLFEDNGYCGWYVEINFGKIVKLYYNAYISNEDSFFYYDLIDKHEITESEYNEQLKYTINVIPE